MTADGPEADWFSVGVMLEALVGWFFQSYAQIRHLQPGQG